MKIEKSLPHNFLAEKAVLNCLILNSELIETTFHNLSIDAFYFKNHQEIYKILIYMYKNNKPIDIITLNTFIQDKGLLKKIGGIRVLIELISQIPNLIYLEEYIDLIKEKFIRRLIIKLGYEIITSGYVTNIPIDTIIVNFENKLFDLKNEIKTKKLLSSAELLNNIFLELRIKCLNPTLNGLASGFYDLDCLTQGFQKSDLIILAARPSIGKTALSLNIMLNIIKNSRLPILFFSLEMSTEQIMYRLLSIETHINQARLRNGKLYKDDWIKILKVMKILSKLPIFINDATNLSVEDIRSNVKTILLKQNQIGLIIIDYLQLIQNFKSGNENRVQELSRITRTLKNIAREFNIPIIALSQLSRNVENRVDKTPVLADLRESGSIEQDADLVIMLNRNNLTNSNKLNDLDYSLIELIIAKQRNGPLGKIKLKFNQNQMKFSNFNL